MALSCKDSEQLFVKILEFRAGSDELMGFSGYITVAGKSWARGVGIHLAVEALS